MSLDPRRLVVVLLILTATLLIDVALAVAILAVLLAGS